MKVIREPDALREALRQIRGDATSLGLVPTMGALHEGHLALVAASRRGNAATVASIFVNPLQFAANEDFATYPRDEARDLAMLEAAGCDLAWLPDAAAMYPPGDATLITVGGPALAWEGAIRPGHFQGVATVVAKLFGQIRPDRAYFGEKDWQQIQVVRRMVTDLLLPVEIVPVPTRRSPEGLALSSRNRYLDPRQRAAAPELHQVLCAMRAELAQGVSVATAIEAGKARLAAAGFAIDYLTLVEPFTLQPLETLTGEARLLAAARLGPVRLLDNIAVLTIS